MYEPVEEEIDMQRSILGEEREPFLIRFYFNYKSTLYGFVANGETGFTQFGLDIIAAGVSALIINTIHSLNHLTKDDVQAEMQRNYSKCILPDLQMKNRGSIEAITLLKSLEIGLQSIQNTYGDTHITIEKIYENQKSGLFKVFK
ncbi:ribosomal-processing cysteine protease Prp [Gorillibacterium massiliense]|uniref:ribosomal-processing cysteine protease Prp n=1 Tax=Gorillibacterium massiliense TaxID=1280390 RepID=UPI00069392CE|nr:ribosomal-processing cysteine protease Prp [Gorillibacterium massiliense]